MAYQDSTQYRQLIAGVKPGKYNALNRLSKKTRIPKAELVREAIDDLLKKYEQRAAA